MFLEVNLDILDETGVKVSSLSNSLDFGNLSFADLPNGLKASFGRMLLQEGTKTYAHVLIWSYFNSKDIWHEVFVTNCSIENPVGFYTGSYRIKVTAPYGAPVEVIRDSGKFYDGTGFVEFIGEPKYSPMPTAVGFYNRYFPSDTQPIVDAANNFKHGDKLESFPHIDWDPSDWTQGKFDTTKNTHTTGSPRNVGITWHLGNFLTLVDSDAKPNITKEIYGYIGQQSRRPVHFLHDANSATYTPEEYPNLAMGEHGPEKIWGSTELWGRDKLKKVTGLWNGWDLEHFTIDYLIVGYLFYGSQFCYMHLKLLLEAVMTSVYVKKVNTGNTVRSFGWVLKALALGIYTNPSTKDVARYKIASQNLIDSYLSSAEYSPIPKVFPLLAKGDQLYPKAQEMIDFYDYKHYEYPTSGEYLNALALWKEDPTETNSHKLAVILVNWLYPNYGYSALYECLYLWSYVPCFQLGVAAVGTVFLNDVLTLGDGKLFTITQHLLLCILNKASNPEGTYWKAYGAVNPYATAGDGQGNTGTQMWICGGLGILLRFAPQIYREGILDNMKKVYLGNKYCLPTDPNFYSWMQAVAVNLGYVTK